MSFWRLAIVTGVSLACYGCASQAPMSAGCGDVTARKITINYKKNETIKVSPPVREIEQGEAIEFRLKGEAGTMVTVSGKGTAAQWISGSDTGSPGGTSFYVCVGGAQNPDAGNFNLVGIVVGKEHPRHVGLAPTDACRRLTARPRTGTLRVREHRPRVFSAPAHPAQSPSHAHPASIGRKLVPRIRGWLVARRYTPGPGAAPTAP